MILPSFWSRSPTGEDAPKYGPAESQQTPFREAGILSVFWEPAFESASRSRQRRGCTIRFEASTASAYSPESAAGTMFGFLNVFLATAFLKAGLDDGIALQVLEEQSAANFQFDETGVTWGGHRLTLGRNTTGERKRDCVVRILLLHRTNP